MSEYMKGDVDHTYADLCSPKDIEIGVLLVDSGEWLLQTCSKISSMSTIMLIKSTSRAYVVTEGVYVEGV